MTENELIESEKLFKVMREKFPESWVTYFPTEQKYMAHIWGKPLSGMHTSRIAAIEEALKDAE
jgi:hypothetical protein